MITQYNTLHGSQCMTLAVLGSEIGTPRDRQTDCASFGLDLETKNPFNIDK